MTVRTRFAPSPTGELHLGSLRTALYAFLWARHCNGQFFIRIEDTDRERLVPGAADRMLAALRRVGLTWDEGPDIGGSRAPYVQSERLEKYRAAAKRLIDEGRAYRCDCSPERLTRLREAQTASKLPTRYDGLCRKRADVDPQQPHVVRFNIARTAEEGSVVCSDLIHGEIIINPATLDDFVLLKSDGWPTYHLAHTVDDHEQETTHVIRGDEWLPSLPRHVLLFRAFKWEAPQYAHLPLLLNAQRKKLSKRDGDIGVESFLTWCLPEALINFTALLGWNPSASEEIYTTGQLIASFDLERVNKSPAIVDFQKLEWLNGLYIRRLSPAELANYLPKTLRPLKVDQTFFYRVLALEQPRLKRLDALPRWYFEPYERRAPLEWKKTDAKGTRERLMSLRKKMETLDPWPDTPAEMEMIVKSWIETQKIGVGETLWPLRVSLSGQQTSPGPFELAWTFGKEETLRRIQYAIDSL